jgi:hypothetical protein
MLTFICDAARADGPHSQVGSAEAAHCSALASHDFSGIVDASAQVGLAKIVRDVDDLLAGLVRNAPADFAEQAKKSVAAFQPYCRVSGYVTPTVGFELLLPVNHWNGKFLHVGCFGWCGSTALVAWACAKYPDYACIGTDMGHTGSGGLWFRNNLQAQIDFSYRATHVTTLAGKAITDYYYGSAPKRSYFMGCSTGGYQGMVEAQRFPWDFDGIVAGAPDMDESDLAVRGVWIKQNFMGRDGKPVLGVGDLELVHQAALASCDMDDGVKDGIISDPVHCKFDPRHLLCGAERQTQCLTEAQVQAAINIYGSPVTSKGIRLSSTGVFPGSEVNWSETFTDTWGDEYFKDTALLTSPGRKWQYTDFDFDHDYARSGADVLFVDTNPDLRKFKSAGGKLISYQGGNDTLQIPGAVVDYYATVEKTMGGRAATQDFFRLFVIPGMNHCTEGDGVFVIDYLSYLEAWVEHRHPPNVMIGRHVKDLPKYGGWGLRVPLAPDMPVAFSKPIYPYPLYPRYRGRGDPTKAENFGPVGK